uniref:Metastasis-associated protein MTA2 n=1 Tax=Pyxicephalus adspersus TaxID=30357 RepID=A0AAV2ZI67_PYXAD|nr:TPA: hypothetical protein GDO54_002739 [Pyxicephalus adspersus]
MDTLQRNGYDLARAMSTLVPQGGPVLCRDEMEEWSASEAMLFEEALEKYGKDFNDIRQDFLPWKSLASIVQFYYMWKTTDRYIQQKRLKAAEADSKLKQVYIPTYTKPNPNQIISVGSKPGLNGAGFQKGLTCESCHTTVSAQWYAWGPPNMQCRLCASCWIYWKKYGGLKTPTQLEGAARNIGVSAQAPLKPKTPRGTKTPINRNQLTQSRSLSVLPTKRAFEAVSGVGVVPPFSANGRSFSGVRSSSQPNVKRQKLNLADAPNPVVFVATKDTRCLRKSLSHMEMRRAARRPNQPLKIKLPLPPRTAVLIPSLPAAHPASTSEPIVLED